MGGCGAHMGHRGNAYTDRQDMEMHTQTDRIWKCIHRQTGYGNAYADMIRKRVRGDDMETRTRTGYGNAYADRIWKRIRRQDMEMHTQTDRIWKCIHRQTGYGNAYADRIWKCIRRQDMET